jgi:transcription initiation factor TFIIB
MSKQTVTHATCPECGCIDVVRDMDMGEAVCCNCGLVIREKILERGPEWRAFTPEERKSRVRAGPTAKYRHFDKGLSTVIRVGRDAFGRPLSPRVRRQMWRLRRWQLRSRFHASKYRNLSIAMDELRRLSEKLHIPSSVQEMAAVIYRKALNKGLTRGRCIAAVVAGALYAACRSTKTPRTLKELAEASFRERREISAAYRLVVRSLRMKMPIDDPMDYVTKIAEKTEVSSDVEGLAIKIIRDAKNNRATMGKDPSGLAAAALYIASRLKKEKITQKRLAKAAEVSEVTVRNRKRGLMETLNLNLG